MGTRKDDSMGEVVTLWKPTHPAHLETGKAYTSPVCAMYNSCGVTGLVAIRCGESFLANKSLCASKCGYWTDDPLLSEAYTIYNPLWGVKAWALNECLPLIEAAIAELNQEPCAAIIDIKNGNFNQKNEDRLYLYGSRGVDKMQRGFYFALRDTERHPMLRPVTLPALCKEASLEVIDGRLRFNPKTCLTLASKLGMYFDREVEADAVKWL